jgi:hypothetical protein
MRISYIDKSSQKQHGTDLLILPTDTEKLKIIIIPVNTLPAKETQRHHDLMLEVQSVLKNCEVSKKKAEEVWLPSFST